MNERPSGTVTFLFTDIEGSTRLWEHHHQSMKSALPLHDQIVQKCVEANGGYVFSTGGDSFSVAFSDPVDAAITACDVHRALADHDWGDIGELRVRAAIDTGLADERDGDYFGPPLNRAARILGHARGGDTLCSHTTADLLKHDLPSGYAVVKFGRRRLKGVEEIETLFRITQPGEAALRPSWVRAVAIVAGVTAIGVGWWATSVGDGADDGTDNDTTTAAGDTTPVTQADLGIVWSVVVGDIVAGPAILGDVVVTATSDSVAAFDLADGRPLWDHGGFERVSDLATDGEYMFVTSAERFDVIHPSTGDLVPRCGFHLPVTFARTGVVNGDMFIMAGSLYRVATNPGGAPCHGPVVENAGTMSALDPTAGPIHTGGVVVAADAVGVYAFDPETLDVVWRYPDRSGPALTVHPPSLVGAEFEDRVRTSSRSTTIVALSDDAGILTLLAASDDAVRAVELPGIRTNRDRPIVITEHAIVAVDARSQLIGIDVESGEIAWRVENVEVIAGPLLTDAWVLIATPSEVVAIDPLDGSRVGATHTQVVPVGFTTWGSTAVIVDSDQTMHNLAVSWPTSPHTWRPPPDPTPSLEPEALVRSFVAAWNRGDREAVEGLIGVDASFLVTGLGEIWSTRAQAMLWTWFDGDQVMQSEWALGSCATESTGATTSTVTCSSTYTDALVRAAGVELDEFATLVTVTNGVVTRVAAGGNISRPGEGGVFTDFGGRSVLHARFDDWASKQHPEEFATACRIADGMGPVCAEFTVSHLDEWAAVFES